MSLRSRREYLGRIRSRYQRAGREHKSRILDEFCHVCGYERKYAIRLLGKGSGGPRRPPGPKPRYGDEEREVLEAVWRQAEQICSKRLKAALPLWLPAYEARHGRLSRTLKRKLQTISPATIDRLLAPVRVVGLRGRSGTRPGSLIRTHIPIRTTYWDESRPGFLEADTVAHCGASMAGDFVWSITYTDIATGWTAMRAVWNRGAQGVVTQTRQVEEELPFAILGFDCDNGSEFLNWHLVKYFTEREMPVKFTRSRAYHKDDNAHVEQKNWTHVRQLLGYERFDQPHLVELINDLYRNEWAWLNNFFLPSMKLDRKERIKSRVVRKHKDPRTPYQRLLTSDALDAKSKRQLKAFYRSLNPFDLKEEVERKLRRVFETHRRGRLKRAS